MPNQAASWRAEVAAELGRPPLILGRGRTHLTVWRPGGRMGRYISSAPVHTLTGEEIDTDLDDTTQPGWLVASRRTDFGLLVGNGARRRIVPRPDTHPGEYIEIERPQWDQGSGWVDMPWTGWSKNGNRLEVDGPGYSGAVICTPTSIRTELTWDSQGYPFRFPTNLVGLTWQDGVLVSDDDGEQVLWLRMEHWEDADGNHGSFGGTWDGTYITYDPDLTGAVFPVTIDPTFSVTTSAADGYVDTNASGFDNSSTTFRYGTGTGTSYHAFVGFGYTGMEDWAGGTITLARLSMYVSSGSTTTDIDIYGTILGATTAAPASYAQWQAQQLNLTTEMLDYNRSSGALGWFNITGLEDVVQEVLDQGTWNGYLLLQLKEAGDAFQACDSYDGTWAPYIYIEVSPPSGFPYIRSYAVGTVSYSGSTMQVTGPETVEADDLIIALITQDDGGNHTAAGSWEQLYADTSNPGDVGHSAHMFYPAVGNEDLTTMSPCTTDDAGEDAFFVTLAIVGADVDNTPADATSTTGDSDTPNSPSHSPSGGSDKYLWLSCMGSDSNDAVTAFPSGMSYFMLEHGGTGNGDAQVAVAAMWGEQATMDPGGFTLAGAEEWVAGTIAIYPAPGGTDATASPIGKQMTLIDRQAGRSASASSTVVTKALVLTALQASGAVVVDAQVDLTVTPFLMVKLQATRTAYAARAPPVKALTLTDVPTTRTAGAAASAGGAAAFTIHDVQATITLAIDAVVALTTKALTFTDVPVSRSAGASVSVVTAALLLLANPVSVVVSVTVTVTTQPIVLSKLDPVASGGAARAPPAGHLSIFSAPAAAAGSALVALTTQALTLTDVQAVPSTASFTDVPVTAKQLTISGPQVTVTVDATVTLTTKALTVEDVQATPLTGASVVVTPTAGLLSIVAVPLEGIWIFATIYLQLAGGPSAFTVTDVPVARGGGTTVVLATQALTLEDVPVTATATASATVTPTAGALTLTDIQVAVELPTGATVTPSSGAITLHAAQAAGSGQATAAPAAGVLTLTGPQAGRAGSALRSPDPAAVAVTPGAPTLTYDTQASPTAGVLTLDSLPVQTVTGASVSRTPTVGALPLTAGAVAGSGDASAVPSLAVLPLTAPQASPAGDANPAPTVSVLPLLAGTTEAYGAIWRVTIGWDARADQTLAWDSRAVQVLMWDAVADQVLEWEAGVVYG